MMRKKYVSLHHIENDHDITMNTDLAFLHLLQQGLLLAMKEQGHLNEFQYRYAEDKLNTQIRSWSRKQIDKEEFYK